MPTPLPPLPATVTAALQRGSPLEAVKLLRQATGLGLGDALALLAKHGARMQPVPRARAGAAQAASTTKPAPQALPRPDARSGLAPGEVPRGHDMGWAVALLLAVAALIGLLFRR